MGLYLVQGSFIFGIYSMACSAPGTGYRCARCCSALFRASFALHSYCCGLFSNRFWMKSDRFTCLFWVVPSIRPMCMQVSALR